MSIMSKSNELVEKEKFYINHFGNLCCYEDYLMTVDLMGIKHNDPRLLSMLPKCSGHKFVIAGGEIIWVGDNGEKVDNPNIDAIQSFTFYHNRELHRVDIPSTIRFIGNWAFGCCENINSLKITDAITNIGDYAFAGCINLTEVKLPSKLIEIGSEAFEGCTSLVSVTIPGSVGVIPNRCFSDNPMLENVEIGNGVHTIKYHAFCNCKKLTEIILPRSIDILDITAFQECDNLKRIKIPASCRLVNNNTAATMDSSILSAYMPKCEVIRY